MGYTSCKNCSYNYCHTYEYKGLYFADYCHITFIEFKEIVDYIDDLLYKGKIKHGENYLKTLMPRLETFDDVNYRGSNLKFICVKNRIKYFYVVMKLIEETKNGSKINDQIIEEALQYGISKSPKAKKFLYLVIPSKEDSDKFVNGIKNTLITINPQDSLFVYNGMSLIDICKTLAIKYEKTKKEVITYLKSHIGNSMEEAIMSCIAKDSKGRARYFYKNKDVRILCIEKGIGYHALKCSLITKQKNLKNKEIFVSMEDLYTEFFKTYELYENLTYKDQRLVDYLRENNISLYTVISYIDTYKDLLTGYTTEELIDMAIYSAQNHRTTLFYKGEPIVDYCRRNLIPVNMFKSFIRSVQKKNSSLTLKEAIKFCVKEIEPITSSECNYKGLSLYRICGLCNFDYNSLLFRLLAEVKKGTHVKIALSMIVRDNLDKDLKIGDEYLLDFCIDRNYDYREVIGLINKSVEEWSKLIAYNNYFRRVQLIKPNERIIKEALSKYEARRNPKHLKSMVDFLKTRTASKNNGLYKAEDFLNVDSYVVTNLLLNGYTPYTATMIIYYFFDCYNVDNNKSISDRKLGDLELLVSLLNEDSLKVLQSINDIYLLIRLYKCDLFDTTNRIFELKRDLISKCVNEYYIPEQLVKKAILEAIDNCNSNDENTMLKAIDEVENTCKTVIVCPSFINMEVMTKTKCKKEDK